MSSHYGTLTIILYHQVGLIDLLKLYCTPSRYQPRLSFSLYGKERQVRRPPYTSWGWSAPKLPIFDAVISLIRASDTRQMPKETPATSMITKNKQKLSSIARKWLWSTYRHRHLEEELSASLIRSKSVTLANRAIISMKLIRVQLTAKEGNCEVTKFWNCNKRNKNNVLKTIDWRQPTGWKYETRQRNSVGYIG